LKKAIAQQKYAHPPIVEAVIDFGVEGEVAFDIATKAASKLSGQYAINAVDFEISGTVEAGAKTSLDISQRQTGRRLISADQADILVISQRSVLFSRKAPYPGWEAFRERIEEELKQIRKIIRNKIRRIGVRFINRLDIPMERDKDEFFQEEYLLAYTQIPDVLQPMTGYKAQFTISVDDGKSVARVSTGAVNSPVPNSVGLLLDIDVIRQVDIPQQNSYLWNVLENQRVLKNMVFETLVTDKAKAFFK
jgi:uncharacterized protein (TIGR04255 family)